MTTYYTGIPDVDYPSDGQDFFDKLYQAGINNRSFDVMAYLYRHADPVDGYVFATYKKIQDETGISAPTISGVMKKLQKIGAIKKINQGIWQLELDSDVTGQPYAFIRREA